MDPNLATSIQVICAVVQAFAAIASIGAAWWIAFEQKRRADEAQQKARCDFIDVVLAIGHAALAFTQKSIDAFREAPAPSITYNWHHRLTDFHLALQPIRTVAPPDANLAVAVARLSRALETPDNLPQPVAIEVMGQHAGSLGIEIAAIADMRSQNPTAREYRPSIFLGA